MTERKSGSAYTTSRLLAWLAIAEGVLGLILLAVWAGRPVGLWSALALAMLALAAGLLELFRTAHARRRRALAALVLLGAGVLLCAEGFAMRRYVLEDIQIPGGSSLIPTLEVGDRVLVSKLPQAPRRGEVIVFGFPGKPNKQFMKRIVGVPGDAVEVCGRQIRLNGQVLSRQPVAGPCAYDDFDANLPAVNWHKVRCVAYREHNGDQSYLTVHDETAAQTPESCRSWSVPAGQVFVLGDNRDRSTDSRSWGFLPAENIAGRVWFIWWSRGPDRIRWSRINQLVHASR